MMSNSDMHKLGGATGNHFDRMWLAMMIEHHQGAIAMAKVELNDGRSESAKTLASHVMDANQVEIDSMTALMTRLRQ